MTRQPQHLCGFTELAGRRQREVAAAIANRIFDVQFDKWRGSTMLFRCIARERPRGLRWQHCNHWPAAESQRDTNLKSGSFPQVFRSVR